MMGRIREPLPTRRSRAISSSASAARRTTISSRRWSWSASAGSRTASSSSTAERPGTKAAELFPDDVPEDVKTAAQQRAAGDPERDQRRGQPAACRPDRSTCWSRARARRRARRGEDAGPVVQLGGPHALRPDRRLRRQPPPDRSDSPHFHPRRHSPHAHRRSRRRNGSPGSSACP